MKNVFKRIAMLATAGFCILTESAYDRDYDFASSFGLFYKCLDKRAHTVMVTYSRAIGFSQKRTFGKLSIPSTVVFDGWRWTVVALDDSVCYNSEITSIKLPNTITHIGKDAFNGCYIHSGDLVIP